MATSVVAELFSPGDGQPPIVTALADYLDSGDTSLYLRLHAVVIGASPESGIRLSA
jgi:hypothetical protein